MIREWEGLTSAWQEGFFGDGPGGNPNTGKYMYGTDRTNVPAWKDVDVDPDSCVYHHTYVRTTNLQQTDDWTIVTPVYFDCSTYDIDEVHSVHTLRTRVPT